MKLSDIIVILSMKFIYFFLASTLWLQSQIPIPVQKLMKYYPQIKSYENGRLIFQDHSTILYDDGKSKSHKELLENADIEDMFKLAYSKGSISKTISRNNDPGRYRNEAFFRKIYGNSAKEVEKNLTEIIWCPKLVNQKIRVSKVNGLDKKLEAISKELDEHPELKKYLTNAGGTFNWRYISGTKRLSQHSFGASIDINVKFSHYWQWDNKSTNEDISLKYKNQIPQIIVDIFEKHGFIWGGKWYHYDTMHFEYRPELLEE
ncbi:MAG: M15 family metallopeptidase [Chitinophagales bacterium]|nr:M15 family metallopeptidase [Sphingobacteriales bacterium]